MYRLDFGRHAGCTLGQVPESYLIWLADNAHSPTLRALARQQLGLPDVLAEADPDGDMCRVGDPDTRSAAEVLPLLRLDWLWRMEAEFGGELDALLVIERGAAVLAELSTAVVGRRAATDEELTAAREELAAEEPATARRKTW